MSIKGYIAAAVVAAGVFGFADRAEAQYRRGGVYVMPSYNTVPNYYPTYNPGVVYSSYSVPSYYNSSGVITTGYGTPFDGGFYNSPYTTGYYDPYAAGFYNSYYTGYSNVYGNPYGVSVGTRGGMILGRRGWRW